MQVSPSFEPVKIRLRAAWRSRRMCEFLERLRPPPGATVLDVGGSVDIWDLVDHRLDVTLLNVDEAHALGFRAPGGTTRRYAIAIGDACDLGRFADRSFDIVFSNSVIEHLGDDSRVLRFADEVRRVGKGYWVQTPAWLFPIESHTGLPFYWLYPPAVRSAIARRLDLRYAKNPWSCPIAQTRSFRLKRLRALFPDASVYTERVGGMTKSWCLYRTMSETPPCS
ncbi:methyltransferase domain-containing protein [Piscinibacter sp. XHJ-5]|uniref:class I SAM-dependent methyltransferase n=1 Tax=Piscinibacter sp. XHJ-5 TaxID=3037797 RepID=UPI002452B433|nr:methyltransferase domain-containing protein [Piscinibacter sp. XHJ-5]